MRALPPIIVSLCLLAASLAPALGETAGVHGYYRMPAIHGDTIVFTAHGDLWKVSAHGGVAQAMTMHPSMEGSAAISPDGKTVAFTAAYEGPTEAYTMPMSGGRPTRLTFGG